LRGPTISHGNQTGGRPRSGPETSFAVLRPPFFMLVATFITLPFNQIRPAILKPMAGLTRYLFLMNVCEKSMTSPNVYAAGGVCKKDADF